MTLLQVRNLSKSFPAGRDFLGRPRNLHLAVDDVSFDLERGETLALVGESGAGKSTTGRLVLRLIEPNAGTVLLDGTDVLALPKGELRQTRRRMQMIFQDPYSSLDPRVPIGNAVMEPLRVHFDLSPTERFRRAATLLERVGISTDTFDRFPGEMSGGQLQRVAIARALTLEPDLIVCDEPVAALDVSVQAQVLNLMLELQNELAISYLFISHDLAVVQGLADQVAVMKDGRIVEVARPSDLFHAPGHDYTRTLISAIPLPVPRSLR